MAIQFSKLKVGDYLKTKDYTINPTYFKVVSINEDRLPIKLQVIGEKEETYWQIPKQEYWRKTLTKVDKKEVYIEMI